MTTYERLSDEAIAEALTALPDWERDGDHIKAEFVFSDFVTAFAFMADIVEDAERLNHHPEWSNVYNRVSVGLTTHDQSGLTGYDIELATVMSAKAALRQS
jgi:4a-hydroxytetrahydrobiopterin dehydratase